MIRKVALFDFDNTLSQGDSISYLLKYYIKKHPLSFFHLLKAGMIYIGYKCHLCTFLQAKEALLFPISKMNDQELEEFYRKEVEPHYYQNVVEELKRKKEEGYLIVLCTASVECYMKYCRLPIDVLIGTKVERKNHQNRNKIISKNCKNEEKVVRIQQYLKDNDYEIDYEHSYAYSDSISDMPMLNMVKNKIRIELKTGKMKEW